MIVLYSAEQKGQPLGSQALTERRTNKKKQQKNELFDVFFFYQKTAILVLQKIQKN